MRTKQVQNNGSPWELWASTASKARPPTDQGRIAPSLEDRGMGGFERVSLWLAAIFGPVFAAGSFYISLAQPFGWWPFKLADMPVMLISKGDTPPVMYTSISGWVLAGFALLGVALLAVVLSFRFRRTLQPDFSGKKPFTQVRNQEFRNSEIPVDGYQYWDCTFENVTFSFAGMEPGGFINCHFRKGGSMAITSKNPVVMQTLELAAKLTNISDRSIPIDMSTTSLPKRN